jgi:hypothetical protein
VRGNPEEWPGTRLSTTAWLRRSGACGEWPRDRHNKPAGEELGTDPAKRTVVNVGTRPVSPHPSPGVGKAQRLLMVPGGGIALVVVAGVTTGLGGWCRSAFCAVGCAMERPWWRARGEGSRRLECFEVRDARACRAWTAVRDGWGGVTPAFGPVRRC